jgi:hypothetical protein
MSVLLAVLWIGGCGLLGGLLNALVSEEGFVLSGVQRLADGRRIWRPGFLGNASVGCVTAIVLAGLYTPLGSVSISGVISYELTIQALVGAVVSGIGGARILMSEVDKRITRNTIGALTSAVQSLSGQRHEEEG